MLDNGLKIKIIRILGFAFTPVYYLVTQVRNLFFDWGVFKSERFSFPVICIGNLSVGGTGKTPMTEYLVQLLSDKYSVGVVSRGYGRKTKASFLAASSDTAFTIGDEPMQYMQKFYGHLPQEFNLYVDTMRARGIHALEEQKPQTEVFLLDDAYQHRQVQAGLHLLLTEYEHPYFYDHCMAWGNLRESRRGIRRADILMVTKCPPTLKESEKMKFLHQIQRESPQFPLQKVFFSTIKYGDFKNIQGENFSISTDSKKIFLFTGIAHPKPLEDYLRAQNLEVVKHFRFADHHIFSEREAVQIRKEYQKIIEGCPVTDSSSFSPPLASSSYTSSFSSPPTSASTPTSTLSHFSSVERVFNMGNGPFSTLEYAPVVLLTTEKDFMRLKDSPAFSYLCDLPLAYLPVTTEILFDESEKFSRFIFQFVDKKQKS
ncbi:MAG: tetraacyldisaccharide 4'-kinase [Bacteroidales bacterium]